VVQEQRLAADPPWPLARAESDQKAGLDRLEQKPLMVISVSRDEIGRLLRLDLVSARSR